MNKEIAKDFLGKKKEEILLNQTNNNNNKEKILIKRKIKKENRFNQFNLLINENIKHLININYNKNIY